MKWIKVTDKLPESWGTYLVMADEMDVMTYDPNAPDLYCSWQARGHKAGDQVTHWRPLPKPPCPHYFAQYQDSDSEDILFLPCEFCGIVKKEPHKTIPPNTTKTCNCNDMGRAGINHWMCPKHNTVHKL